MRLPDPPILVITDRHRCAEPLETRAIALFRGGCRWLSLRENDLEPAARLSLLRRLIEAAQPFGATVTVHRDIDAAHASRVGLHLPAGAPLAEARRRLGHDWLLGQSCHDAAEICAAGDADYVTISPVFETSSKPGYGPALGPARLAALSASTRIPVLALGGVTASNLPALAGAGIAGIATMGEAMSAPEPQAWFRALAAEWRHLSRS